MRSLRMWDILVDSIIIYSFKAPAETPLMKSRCIIHISTNTGMMMRQPIAAMGPQRNPMSVMNPAMVTVNGLALFTDKITP